MSLNLLPILEAAQTHAAASGHFDRVTGHEPKNPPGRGLTAAIWVQRIGPVPAGSGLRSTSGRVELRVRLLSLMLQEPQDAIDPNLTDALDALFVAYSGDFTLGGLVMQVDLLGAYGTPLSSVAGYLSISNQMHRIYDITLPCIVSDLWDQAP